MGHFLNCCAPCNKYKEISETTYFVDKTWLLDDLLRCVGDGTRYFCITRPRRFGKSIMANMVGAFFGRAMDSREIFGKLAIAGSEKYQGHINQHNVIYIDFSEVPQDCRTYQQYISRISGGIKADLAEAYPDMPLDPGMSVWDMLSLLFEKKGQRYIFVIDEWDAVFHMSFLTEEEEAAYLLFLKTLLKDKGYVELAYMTGILPIAKYSDGSELNMFIEYNMATKTLFSGYFGFTDDEVDDLYRKYLNRQRNPRVTREGLREWYDGYSTAGGERLYNPRSVICSLVDNQLSNYWTSSGTYDSIFHYIKDDVDEVQDDIALMAAGEAVPAMIQEYAVTSRHLGTKDEIYSAMTVYGLLSYEDGYVSIPNKELMDSYAAMMKKEKSLGYVYRLASVSEKMLESTLSGDTDTMAAILDYAHNTESPILSYNTEAELAVVVSLVYLAARDRYRIEREYKAGKGFADFLFYPVRPRDDCIILELKVGSTPQEAVQQILEKEHALRFCGKLGEKPKYTGRILAVGISYDRETKKHSCMVRNCIEISPPISN